MKVSEENLAARRRGMVDKQLRARGVRHKGVLQAMSEVPRERFILAAHAEEAYEDHPLPIGYGQTISQPYIVGLMLQELDPKPEHRVLDVGAGSGYQTALLSRLVRHVYAIERIDELTEQAINAVAGIGAANVTIITGDGSLGWPEEAPFDRIICGAAAPDIPEPWLDQLADGGRIVLPIGGPNVQTLTAMDKRNGEFHRRKLCDVRFVRLFGRAGW